MIFISLESVQISKKVKHINNDLYRSIPSRAQKDHLEETNLLESFFPSH